MPNYALVIDLAVIQNDEQKLMMNFGVLEGKPIIYELQNLLTSGLSKAGNRSVKSRSKIVDKVFKEMKVPLPVGIMKNNLDKTFQREALFCGGCQDLQPQFELIFFLSKYAEQKLRLHNQEAIRRLLVRSESENFVLKRGSGVRGDANIFLTRADLENYAGEKYDDFCELEFKLGNSDDKTTKPTKIKEEKGVRFSLEECINPSFYEKTGQGAVYRIAIFYNSRLRNSCIKLVTTYHLNEASPNSHFYQNSLRSDHIDKVRYRHDELRRVVDVNRVDIQDIILGDSLVSDLLRATRAYVNFVEDYSIAIKKDDFTIITKLPTPSKKSKDTDVSIRSSMARISNCKYIKNLCSLLFNIGFKNEIYTDIELKDGRLLQIMLKVDDLDNQIENAFCSNDSIKQKGQNLLHLLIPHILKNEMLERFDLDDFSHAKKLLLYLIGYDPKHCGKELFTDCLVKSAIMLQGELEVFVEHNLSLPSGKFDFPGVVISEEINGINRTITYEPGAILESAPKFSEVAYTTSKTLPCHRIDDESIAWFSGGVGAGMGVVSGVETVAEVRVGSGVEVGTEAGSGGIRAAATTNIKVKSSKSLLNRIFCCYNQKR